MNTLILKRGDKSRFVSLGSSGELFVSCDNQKTLLGSDMTDDFDVLADSDGTLHIFGIDASSNLVYIRLQNSQVTSDIILQSKSEGSRLCNVRFFKINGRFHLFYCVDHTERLLVHQIVSDGDHYMEPVPIGVIGKSMLYDAVKDDGGNIHIVYASPDGGLVRQRYIYSTKKHTAPQKILVYDAISLNAVYFEDELYCAFTASDKGRVSVYVCKCRESLVSEVGMRVHIRTEVALIPCGKELLAEWTENSMSFAVPCNSKLEKGKVRIEGRTNGMVSVRCEGCDIGISRASMSLGGQLFCDADKLIVAPKEQKPEPVGYEADLLSQKYIEVLSNKNNFVDFEREFTRIEAALERLVMLVEGALKEMSDADKSPQIEEQESQNDTECQIEEIKEEE